MLWWQPIALPIGVKELFAFKMAGFLAVTVSLGRHIAEQQKRLDGRVEVARVTVWLDRPIAEPEQPAVARRVPAFAHSTPADGP
jgi:hypothetical protein